MPEELGDAALEKDQRSFLSPNPPLASPREHDFSGQTAAAIDKQVRKILEQALERPVTILTRNRVAVQRAAKRLPEKETLYENELKELLQPNEQRIALV